MLGTLNIGALETGPLHQFRDWPNREIPKIAAGVYTVWRGDEFIYVGMAGRALTASHIAEYRKAETKLTGLFNRLDSHASGRRSGDQFCVYVCDRFVLPQLSAADIGEISAGRLSLDSLTKQYIHDKLTYRFLEFPDGRSAYEAETQIQKGRLKAGKPFLNPLP